MLFKIMKNIVIGLLVGLSTSYVVVTLTTFFGEDNMMMGDNLLEELIIAACMGIVIGLAMLVFDSTKLSFTVQLIIHFCIVTLCVFLGGLVGEWFDFSVWQTLVKVFVIEVVAYVIIWFLVSILLRREVNEINKMIQTRKEE